MSMNKADENYRAFKLFSTLDIDRNGSISIQEINRMLAGDIPNTFIINFDHPDTGIIWGFDSHGCVVIESIQIGSPAFQIQQLVHGLRLIRLNDYHIEENNTNSLTKLLQYVISLSNIPIEYEFLEPILIITSFGNVIDVQIDGQIYSIELPIGAIYDLPLFQKIVQLNIEKTNPKLKDFHISIHETKRQISFSSSKYSFKLLFGSGPNYHRSCRFALGFQAIDYPLSNEVIGQVMAISINLGLNEKQLTELTKDLFKQFDKDESGQLDFEEFRDFYIRFFSNEESIENLLSYPKFRFRDKEVEAYWQKKQKDKVERINRKKEARLIHQKILERQQMKIFAQSVLSNDGIRRRLPKISTHKSSLSSSSMASYSSYSSQMSMSVVDSLSYDSLSYDSRSVILPPRRLPASLIPKKKLSRLSPIIEYKHDPRKEYLLKTLNSELEIALRLSYQHLIRVRKDLSNIITLQFDIRPWISSPALTFDVPIFQYLNASSSKLIKTIELNGNLSSKVLHPGILNYYMIKEERIHSVCDSSLCHPVFFNSDYVRNDQTCMRHTTNSLAMCRMLDEECNAGRIYRQQHQMENMNGHMHIPHDEQNKFRSMLQKYQRMKEYQSTYFQKRVKNHQMIGRITISSIVFSMKKSILPSRFRRSSINVVISRCRSIDQQHQQLNRVLTDQNQISGDKFAWHALHYAIPIERENILKIDVYNLLKPYDQFIITAQDLDFLFTQKYPGQYQHTMIMNNGNQIELSLSFEHGDEYDWHVQSHQSIEPRIMEYHSSQQLQPQNVSFPIRLRISSLIVYDVTFSSWNLLSKAMIVVVEVDDKKEIIDYSKCHAHNEMCLDFSMITLMSSVRVTVYSMIPVKELVGQYFIMAHEIISLPIDANNEVILYGTIKNRDKDVGHVTIKAKYESIHPLIRKPPQVSSMPKPVKERLLEGSSNYGSYIEEEDSLGSFTTDTFSIVRPMSRPQLETNRVKVIKEEKQQHHKGPSIRKSSPTKILTSEDMTNDIEMQAVKAKAYTPPYVEERYHDIEEIVFNRQTQSNLQLVESFLASNQQNRLSKTDKAQEIKVKSFLESKSVSIAHVQCFDLVSVHRNNGKNSPKLHIEIDSILKESLKPIPYGGSTGKWENIGWKLPDIDAHVHNAWQIKIHVTSNQTFIGRMRIPLHILYENIRKLENTQDIIVDGKTRMWRDDKDNLVIFECGLESDMKSNRSLFNKAMKEGVAVSESVVTGKLQLFIQYRSVSSACDNMVDVVDGIVDLGTLDDSAKDEKDYNSIDTSFSPLSPLKSSLYSSSSRTPNLIKRVSFADMERFESSSRLTSPSRFSSQSSMRSKSRKLKIITDRVYKQENRKHYFAKVFVGRLLYEVVQSFAAFDRQESYEPAPIQSLDFFDYSEKSLKVVLSEHEDRLKSLRDRNEIIEEVAVMKVKEYVWGACQLIVNRKLKDYVPVTKVEPLKSPRRAGFIGYHANESSTSSSKPIQVNIPNKFRSISLDPFYQHVNYHLKRRKNYEKNIALNNQHSKIVREIYFGDLMPLKVFLKVLRILDIDFRVGSLSPRRIPKSMYVTACQPNHYWSIETKSVEISSHGTLDFEKIADEGTFLTAGQSLKFHLRNSYINDSIYATFTLAFEDLFTKEMRKRLSSTGVLSVPVNFIPSNQASHLVIPGFIELSLDFSFNTSPSTNSRKYEAFPYRYWRSYVLPPVSIGLTQQKYLDASLEYDHQMRIHPSLFGMKIRWHDQNISEESKYTHPLFYHYTLNRQQVDQKPGILGRAAKGRRKPLVRNERFMFDPYERGQKRCPVCRDGVDGCPRCYMLPENSFRETYGFNPYRDNDRIYQEESSKDTTTFAKKRNDETESVDSSYLDEESVNDNLSNSSSYIPTTLHTNLTTFASIRLFRNMFFTYTTVYVKILPSGNIKKILVDSQNDTVYHLYHRFMSVAPHTVGEAPRQPMLILPTTSGHFELTPTLFYDNNLQPTDSSAIKPLSKYFMPSTSRRLCLFYFSHHENSASMQHMITLFLLRNIPENRIKSDDLNVLSYYSILPKQPVSISSDTIQQSVLALLSEQYRRQQIDIEVNYYRDLGLKYRRFLKETSGITDLMIETKPSTILIKTLPNQSSKKVILGQRRKLTIDPVTGKMIWKQHHRNALSPIHQAVNTLSKKLNERILYDDETSSSYTNDSSTIESSSLISNSTFTGLISLPSYVERSLADDLSISTSSSMTRTRTPQSSLQSPSESLLTKSSWASSSLSPFDRESNSTSYSSCSPYTPSSHSYSELSFVSTLSTPFQLNRSKTMHTNESFISSTNSESSYTRSLSPSKSFQSSRSTGSVVYDNEEEDGSEDSRSVDSDEEGSRIDSITSAWDSLYSVSNASAHSLTEIRAVHK